MPLAEIISVGTELLLGEIVDSNAAYLAQELAAGAGQASSPIGEPYPRPTVRAD